MKMKRLAKYILWYILVVSACISITAYPPVKSFAQIGNTPVIPVKPIPIEVIKNLASSPETKRDSLLAESALKERNMVTNALIKKALSQEKEIAQLKAEIAQLKRKSSHTPIADTSTHNPAYVVDIPIKKKPSLFKRIGNMFKKSK